MKPKYARCNICGSCAQMTEDHVPPKFWHNSNLKYYSQGFGGYDPPQASSWFPYKSRNGITFQTICADCNNRVLGTKDKALKDFCDQIKRRSNSKLVLSMLFNCHIHANAVAKAVIGHMLAAKEYYDEDSAIEKVLRPYVLCDKMVPPTNMQLLYFYYPWNYIVVGRDVVVSRLASRNDKYRTPTGVISCLYSYPLAFILTDSNQDLRLRDLFAYCRTNPNSKVDVLFDLNSQFYPGSKELRNALWPMNVSDDSDGVQMLLGGKSLQRLIIGTEKPNSKKN